MRKGLDRREVESLAKTMEVKFSVCGPPIGGAERYRLRPTVRASAMCWTAGTRP